MMNCLANMSTILVLFLMFALANTATIRVTPETERNRATTFTSICPTELRNVVIDTAVHYTTRQIVRLARTKGERTKFSVGRCVLLQPINYTRGICAMTVQKYKTYIRVTKNYKNMHRFKECKQVPHRPRLCDCLEWIELPGLCQHKISV